MFDSFTFPESSLKFSRSNSLSNWPKHQLSHITLILTFPIFVAPVLWQHFTRSWRRETNPHIGRPQNDDQHSQLPSSGVVTPKTQARRPDQQNQLQQTHSKKRLSPWFTQPPLQPNGQDRLDRIPSSTPSQTKKSEQPVGAWTAMQDSHGQRVWQPEPQEEYSRPQGSSPREQPLELQPKQEGQHYPPLSAEPVQSHHRNHRRLLHGPIVPSPPPTRLITWFFAGFCVIFWLVIILGGLIVLIVYLLFRPHNPRFDVSSVTLNAAYLDVGVLLNADLTVLANFTNPNKKVKVDFGKVVLDLYYGKTLIVSQYVAPFSAARATSWLTNVHMVTSQVRLPLSETETLKKEINNNALMFQVKGVFRVRSNFGSFLRYSYGLNGHCIIIMTGPPSGIMRSCKCKTKR